MKKILSLSGIAVAVALLSFPVWAEDASVELGKKLFSNPGLGASQNALSCNTCHPEGVGLEKAGGNPNLAALINQCIVGPLSGEKINEETVAMQSLKLYIQSLNK